MAAERAPSVLITADTVGGVWSYALELAQGLAQRGWRIHLAIMGAPLSPYQRAQAAAIDRLHLHESRFKLEWMNEPWNDLEQAARWLLTLESELRPQVVHLNQFVFGALPFKAPTLLVGHSCVLSWWRAVHGQDAPPAWDRYRDCVARGLAGASLVAAPTRAMLESLRHHYRLRGEACVLPNGRDPALFQPAAKQGFVLAAGRLWDPAKNLAALEAVAPTLPWPVRVAGACTGPDGAIRHPAWVQALGQLPSPELARQMSRAAIYAFPARYEPFGLSVLEAALSGCALVLGDIDSLRETWGEAALYVRPDDHLALRDTLVALIAQPERRAHLELAARERALAFASDQMTQATLAAYGRLPALKARAAAREFTCA